MFGFGKKHGGVIAYHHLEDFWDDCTEEERRLLDHYRAQTLSSDRSGLNKGSPNNGLFRSSLAFYWIMLGWAVADKRYDLCDKMVKYGDLIVNDAEMVDRHFYLQSVGELYYTQRDLRPDAISLCESYCMADVSLFPKYKREMLKEFGSMPRLKTFQRLAIMYEKARRWDDAIRICQTAINYGLIDGTKGGYEARLEKLMKKRGT